MCTNFKMKQATDGTVVVGRSQEYAINIPTSIGVLPIGFLGASLVPDGATSSVEWVSKYGVVGMAGFGNAAWLFDGMNTAGMSLHGLAMPNGYCVYSEPKNDGTDVSVNDFAAFILGTCGSVAEAKAAAATVNVWGKDVGMGFVPPLHFLIHDPQASVSIEFHDGVMHIVDNPTSIGTNAPFLDWHLTNLNNFVGLQQLGRNPVEALGSTFAPFGQGGGVMGLPGDYTGPSRFVRAAAFVALSDVPKDSSTAENQTLHMLNAFDIPTGILHEEVSGKIANVVTQWVTMSNLTAQRYSYRTEDDPTVYTVKLNSIDFTKPARTVPIASGGGFTIVEV